MYGHNSILHNRIVKVCVFVLLYRFLYFHIRIHLYDYSYNCILHNRIVDVYVYEFLYMYMYVVLYMYIFVFTSMVTILFYIIEL